MYLRKKEIFFCILFIEYLQYNTIQLYNFTRCNFTLNYGVFDGRILIPATLCAPVNVRDNLTPLIVLFDFEHLRDVHKNGSGI